MTFPLDVTRQELTKFLCRYEVFQRVLGVHGNIIEGGVLDGAGIGTWAHLSAIFEPYNHTRRIIGFDTFTGFPSVDLKDGSHRNGEMAADSEAAILEAMRRYDANRPIGQIPKVFLVRGDATVTMPQYLAAHPETVVALLHLDFDIYAPTLAALKTFAPRCTRGSVLLFDECCNVNWPGETVAVLESVGLRDLTLQRFPWTSTQSFAVLG